MKRTITSVIASVVMADPCQTNLNAAGNELYPVLPETLCKKAFP